MNGDPYSQQFSYPYVEIVRPPRSAQERAVRPKPRILGAEELGSCLRFVEQRRGIAGGLISPKHLWETGKVYAISPAQGLIVVLKEGPVWHAAWIEEVTEDMIYISETNYIPRAYSERWIKRDSDKIAGFF